MTRMFINIDHNLKLLDTLHAAVYWFLGKYYKHPHAEVNKYAKANF